MTVIANLVDVYERERRLMAPFERIPVAPPVDALGVQQMQIRLGCRHAGMPEQIAKDQQRVGLGQVQRQGIIAAGVYDQFRGLLVVAADQTFQGVHRERMSEHVRMHVPESGVVPCPDADRRPIQHGRPVHERTAVGPHRQQRAATARRDQPPKITRRRRLDPSPWTRPIVPPGHAGAPSRRP